MRQHPHIIHINRALELQFRGDDLANDSLTVVLSAPTLILGMRVY